MILILLVLTRGKEDHFLISDISSEISGEKDKTPLFINFLNPTKTTQYILQINSTILANVTAFNLTNDKNTMFYYGMFLWQSIFTCCKDTKSVLFVKMYNFP